MSLGADVVNRKQGGKWNNVGTKVRKDAFNPSFQQVLWQTV